MQFRLWFEKKKKKENADWGEEEYVDPSTSVRLQNNPSVISQHKLVELLQFSVHSFRVKYIQKEKYKRKFGRKSHLYAPSTSTLFFLFFFLYTRVFIFGGYKLYGSRATALSQVCFFFQPPRYEVTFKKKRIRERRKWKRIYTIVCLTFPVRLL